MEPVFVGDVVKMIRAVLDNPDTFRKIYNLPGGAIYDLQEIFAIIGRFLGIKRLVFPVSGRFLLPFLRVYETLSSKPILTSSQVKKWLQNRPLDTSLTNKDLNYHPVSFEEGMRFVFDGKKND